MHMRRFAFAIVLTFGTAAALQAQQHQHGARGQDMTAMHCGAGMGAMHGMSAGQQQMPAGQHNMMEMMGPPTPAMILHHKQELGLSAQQVARLETLQKEAEPSCTRHMQLAMTAHKAANELLAAAAPDFAAFAAKLKESTAHMVEGHVALARAAVAARDVLSLEQRQTLENLMEKMHKK
jgi:hypothetical protein